MIRLNLSLCAGIAALLIISPARGWAQPVEIVGSRALGMGGAFVAVANDNSATWWNPAGLAVGPFLDLALSRSVTEVDDALPARRDRVSGLSLGTPPFGLSYYRLRFTDIPALPTTDLPTADRQGEQTELHVRSLAGTQLGVTVLQSVLPGIHVGATLKYLRATLRTAVDTEARSLPDLLDAGEDLEGGEAQSRFDLDLGVLASGGPVQIGAVIRNVRAPVFDTSASGSGLPVAAFVLPRQFRLGAAYVGEKGGGIPLTVAVDFDVKRYATSGGDRRVFAAGAEQWLVSHRLAIRGGGRFNLAGVEDKAATGGVSVALRSGTYLDAHIVRGSTPDERGWGVASRVSF